MPLPVLLAHKLMKVMSEDRKSGRCTWLRPDSKSQVSLAYDGNTPKEVTAVVALRSIPPTPTRRASPRSFAKSSRRGARQLVAPRRDPVRESDRRLQPRRPSADAGVTGRKIIVDSYGGAGRRMAARRSAVRIRQGRPQQRVFLPLRGQAGRRLGPRQEGGDSGGIRHRHGEAGVGQGRHVRNRRRPRGRGVRDQRLRLPAAGDRARRLDLLRPIYRSTTNYSTSDDRGCRGKRSKSQRRSRARSSEQFAAGRA